MRSRCKVVCIDSRRRIGSRDGGRMTKTGDETVDSMFDEIVETKITADGGVEVNLVSPNAEETEFMDAAMAYAQAERRRVRLSRRKEATCEEWDSIDKVHCCEKKLYALFTEGDRSMRMNGMYNQYVKMLVDPPKPQA
jgi:hypothetical protein